MTQRFCDRDGTLIDPGDAFTLTWFNGRRQITSDLCASCQAQLVTWFGAGNPDPQAVTIDPATLTSANLIIPPPIVPVPPVGKV